MTQNKPALTGFRDDINGLRAWAVVAVVLYHFGVPGFSGGFVGVDIFFVISGLLMTGIVVTGLERGTFSVISFYMARARRIVPALVVLCAVLLLLGWWMLPPADYKLLGVHAASSLAFVSNMKYWLEAGYFDATSHDKWLLHTWSLAVEWQFYLLLPLVLLGVWKLRPGRTPLTWVLAIGLLLSYGLCIALTPTKPTGTFFVLPTRAWEMLAGGLVYLGATRLALSTGMRRALEAAGLALAVGAILVFDTTTLWPGWQAMVPVLGSALVLLAGRSDSVWTGNSIAQWLGTRSYSIYLWHWPIVVALRYLDVQAAPLAIAAGLLLTIALGHLSYQWVETPARKQFNKLSLGFSAAALAGTTAVVATAGMVIQLQQGVLGRFPHELEVISQATLDKNPRRDACHPSKGISSPSCMYGEGPLRAIVLGDSHADAAVNGVAAAVPSNHAGAVMQWSYSGCPIFIGAHRMGFDGNNKCGDFVTWVFQKLPEIPKNVPIVVINRLGQYAFGKFTQGQVSTPWVYFSRPYATAEPAFLKEYAQHITEAACALAKEHPVYLVRPFPEMNVDIPNTARAMVWGHESATSLSLTDYRQRNGFIWAAQDAAREQCGVKILDPLPYLCKDGACQGLKNGRPVYYDDNHLSEFGNRLLVPMFAKVFEPL